MRWAFSIPPTLRDPALKRRAGAMALTLAAHLLLLLLLLRLAEPHATRRVESNPLMTFDIAAGKQEPAPKPRVRARSKSAERPPPAAPVTPPLPQVVTTTMPDLIPGLEKFDLRNVPSAGPRGQTADAGQGQDSASAYGPGEGPGGARLYNAEWYREPSNAELSTYLPARMQTGWGMIACQTVARNRVDNCRELGSDPPGSGLARAVRQAAWQFLVRPPRIDGKPQIGAWVRIRIEFSEAGAAIDRSGRR